MIKINTLLVSFLFVLSLSLLLLPTSLSAQRHSRIEVKPAARKKWVRQTRRVLKQISPHTASERVPVWTQNIDGLIKQSYSVESAGLILFEADDWVYVALHSSHDNPKIGDVAIAIDQDGNQYYHLGHVCGGAIDYETTSEKLYTTSEEFFQHFEDSIDERSWYPLKKNFVPVQESSHSLNRRIPLWKTQ